MPVVSILDQLKEGDFAMTPNVMAIVLIKPIR